MKGPHLPSNATQPAEALATRQGEPDTALPAWQPILLAAMAGGMGWGIRGQYGHETGAMIAGLLISLVLVLLFCSGAASLSAARAVAWCTVAIGFGGSMTYAQTVGLTKDEPFIGNWEALRWGMLGLAIKGGLWIGFAGVFLGMGLSGVRYRCGELLLLMLALVGLFVTGIYVLNSPYDPANRVLPKIYFSADWYWRPDADDVKPRREVWGGLVFALIGLIRYTAGVRQDRLARNLALWGIIGGAIGFPLGQSLQAFHAWNPDIFRTGFWTKLDPNINWWNMMETTFGAVAGGTLGLGLWLNRRRIADLTPVPEVSLSPLFEYLLVAIHVTLLIMAEFGSVRFMKFIYEYGVVIGIIPIVATLGGRWWPYLVMLPIAVAPVAGKTVRQLAYRETTIEPALGWAVYVLLPLVLATSAAIWLGSRARAGLDGRSMARRALLIDTWLFFGLNFAFFHFPWPWRPWTQRTPNGIIFAVCALGLTVAAIAIGGGVLKRLTAGQSPQAAPGAAPRSR